MTTHTIDHNRATQWKINQDNDTWTLAANTQLTVSGAPAVMVDGGFDGNTININGRITAKGGEAIGIYDRAIATTINVGAKAEITGVASIYGDGLNTTINNKGDIDANVYGVSMSHDAHIENSGKIEGVMAVTLGGSNSPSPATMGSSKMADFDNVVINHKQGEINGLSTGVILKGDDHQKLVNDGLISGGDAAIYVTGGKANIVNHGTIDGVVSLSYDNDMIDARRGVINGEVRGNSGDDTYIVSKTHVDIVEGDSGGGYDTVKSDANHKLAVNVERLLLSGKGDTDGTGNAGDNFIFGNAGDNHLKGLGGADIMRGGAGNDVLTGGADHDTFVFNKGDGKDTVTDFHHGEDGISLFTFHGAANFDEVSSHLVDHGKDVWLSYGDDTLIIRGVHEADLDASDFSFALTF